MSKDKKQDTLSSMANKLCKLSEKNHMTVHTDDQGRITNWRTLAPITKEDILEEEHDNVDYSHSKYKYPALHQYNLKHYKE